MSYNNTIIAVCILLASIINVKHFNFQKKDKNHFLNKVLFYGFIQPNYYKKNKFISFKKNIPQ